MAQNGETPLHIAAGQGKSECLQLLLNSVPSTAGVEAVTQDGLTPLHFAARAGSLKCVQLRRFLSPSDVALFLTVLP
jgi:ankyrin repeat protein